MRISPYVLSIGKISAGREGYYLASVADAAEEYYLGAGEAKGRWRASSQSLLGLKGEVRGEDLRAVLAGVDPSSGTELAAGACRKVQGFDLTFSAPKSVSLLHAFADRDTSRSVVAAHERAVDAALDWLEREACRVRRGHAGAVVQEGAGFVAAGFRHRTSRLGDPQLHTHVLVANMAQGPDGRWSALDARPLYRLLRTAGYLYEAELRAGLTRRLGVVWQPAVKGIAEIAGIPQRVLRVFSKRRAAIEAQLDELGLSSPAAAQVAALATRPVKTTVEPGELGRRWQREADAVGFNGFELARVLAQARAGRGQRARAIGLVTDVSQELAAALTEHASSFDRTDVLRALAEHARFGARVAQLEQAADRFLAGEHVVRLDDGSFSDPNLVTVEADLLNIAVAGRDQHVAQIPAQDIDAAIAASDVRLSREQQRMIRHLARSGNGVDVVIGAAGAGKTTALGAARTAWENAGIDVVGCALAARAAQQLTDGAGIPSVTIAKVLQHLDRGQPIPGGVLVVDEAGMVGTRTLHRLAHAACSSGVKLVLVGDPRQLPEINAGGAFAALARTMPAVTLSENRRQRDRVERRVVRDLRHGRTGRALRRLQRHGRVVLSADPRAAMVAEWATRSGDVLLLASRTSDVAWLNHAAQQQRVARGELTGPVIELDERRLHVGDRIMCGRNHHGLGVLNGTTGVITAIEQPTGAVTIAVGDQRVELPGWYVAEHVQLGYATTIHKAQGATVDHALVLADGALYREAGYTALTRGRHTNTLYAATHETLGLEAHGRARELDDPLRDVINHVRRSQAQTLAIDRGISIAD
jgi:conjugative relaxase-like TrwC/TraI family protein